MDQLTNPTEIYNAVEEYYGRVLSSSDDLKTDACTTCHSPPKHILDILKLVPEEVKAKYYGCGTPLPLGIDGLDVLDLGSGSGRDCYVASQLVGPTGSVTGIDMTDEQLEVARRNIGEYASKLGYSPNLRFIKGFIEFLEVAGIENNSIDLCISNCVVNLSPNKELVIAGVYKALKEGGEFYFSDVYADRPVPESVRQHPVLVGECLGGALEIKEFKRICNEVGFLDVRMLSKSPIDVKDPSLISLVGDIQFYSITYRLFKLSTLETVRKNDGHVATYLGTIPGQPDHYNLDGCTRLPVNQPTPVSGNSAEMLTKTWLAKYFKVEKDSKHIDVKFESCEPVVTKSCC
ncbi:methyltransferase type 11 [Basidiobolus meristosporus CBS 931.73]|uniref:Arsenite methyltransferase n=1 Tax=Basidiobolus meristosporus CBS 931.73 TaxID=1314790 RepID=A0A1Y1YEC6_9FUNG|nr:methyltransferase type 11 [Basidiobolus meristosporus CBS 931.73]|eukprot:ORX96339.1 methyltransferase type 11 [Basidiobolus meristosporus CBS 931.73]